MSRQADFPNADPEALLRFMELETLKSRTLREKAQQSRMVKGALALGLLIVVAVGALMLLFSMLKEMRHPSLPQEVSSLYSVPNPASGMAAACLVKISNG